MKKINLLLVIVTIISTVSFAQNGKKDSLAPSYRPEVPSTAEKKAELEHWLDSLVYTQKPLPDEQFLEVVYADFTKLLQAGSTVGKPLNFAALDLTTSKGSVNYTVGPKKSKKWFLTLGASGGFENDIISLISGQKPATSYSASASISYFLSPVYKYAGSGEGTMSEDSYLLKKRLKAEYSGIHVYVYEQELLEYLEEQIRAYARTLSSYYTNLDVLNQEYSKKLNKDEDIMKQWEQKKQQIKRQLDQDEESYEELRSEKDELEKSISQRREKLSAMFKDFGYRSKHLFWLTFSQKAGGSQFRFYDIASPEKSISNGKTRQSNYQSSLTGNYYYKSINKNIRLLLSAGLAAGNFNNFEELSGSDFKVSEKKDVSSNSYTKTDSYTVYDETLFSNYHAGKTYLEAYLLFTKNGNFGIRSRFTWEMPYGTNIDDIKRRRSQQNAEFGVIINSNSKATGEKKDSSPISFEVFYNFNDLDGRQYDASGKFYKRNEIGIKTAIPFSF